MPLANCVTAMQKPYPPHTNTVKYFMLECKRSNQLRKKYSKNNLQLHGILGHISHELITSQLKRTDSKMTYGYICYLSIK